MPDFLKIEREGPIVILTMSQPETRNALTGNTAVSELVAACTQVSGDLSVRCVILTGDGPAFCSGGNVKDMRRYADPTLTPAEICEEYRQGIQRLPQALYDLEVPTIAAINGPAMGAGCDLACMCDIRIASESAVFAESFIKFGIVPGDGGAWLLPRAVGRSKAAEMAFTGDRLDAHQALGCGLVSRVVPATQLLDAARELARRIAVHPGLALRLTKRLMRAGEFLRLDSTLELSASYQALAHKTEEHKEAVNAFLATRTPRVEAQ